MIVYRGFFIVTPSRGGATYADNQEGVKLAAGNTAAARRAVDDWHSAQGRVRRDRIGRKIGRNWFRELAVQTWRSAYDAWCLELEIASNGWQTEAREFRELHPCPTFKSTLIGLAS